MQSCLGTMQVYVEGVLCRKGVDMYRRQVADLMISLLLLLFLFAKAFQELHSLH